MTTRSVLLVLALVAAGCGSKKSDGGGGGSGGGGGGSGSDVNKPHHAGNCPSTVAHSTTTSAAEGSDVLVTITSEDQEAVAAVQKRADELIAARSGHPNADGQLHEQNGEHGGGGGMCPVYIPKGATATAKRVPNGVVVAIAADDPTALKTEIDGRIQRSADWTKSNIPTGDKGTGGGVGGGKNNEGMNHSGQGDGKGMERRKAAEGSGAASGATAPP